MDNSIGVVNEVAALTQKIGVPRRDEVIHYVVVPKDCDVKSLKDFQYPQGMPPSRIIAQPSFRDWESFCLYVNRFKGAGTIVFGDPKEKRFHATIDYHEPADESMETAADFGDHQAWFPMSYSPQWNMWFGANTKLFTQTEFAEFIEDNYQDILRPSAAEMMQVARELKAKSEVVFNSKVNLVDGSANFTYVEDIKAGTNGELEIPEVFTIKIPVFYGEPPQEINARLRYRITQGKLTFHYKLYRTSEILEEAFLKTAIAIGQEVDRKVLLGTR